MWRKGASRGGGLWGKLWGTGLPQSQFAVRSPVSKSTSSWSGTSIFGCRRVAFFFPGRDRKSKLPLVGIVDDVMAAVTCAGGPDGNPDDGNPAPAPGATLVAAPVAAVPGIGSEKT